MTPGQITYAQAIRQNKIVFGLGPAGTGKTLLACAAAAELLRHGSVERIVLTRPAVECGERLGFLPGEADAKIHPYLRPLFDAFREFYIAEELSHFQHNGTIEACPLAYLRGCTFKKTVVLADEMQNANRAQLEMLLTRYGHGCKMILCGDTDQPDLSAHHGGNSIVAVADELKGLKDVAVIRLTEEDIMREPIVADMVKIFRRNRPRT
jgi:phosphate starvation-inducible PhoH-like protein